MTSALRFLSNELKDKVAVEVNLAEAKIVRGNEEMILTEDQSTYIPLGTAHRLENPGKIPLHVIEVQSGSYLGEDDIVRFDDRYRRD